MIVVLNVVNILQRAMIRKPLSRGLAPLNHIPQAQKQEAVAIDLSKDGNILLYGSPGTGKTTFLQTAAMDLARKQSPENLTMYLLDFGTNGLAPLSQLPHVADSLLLDQTEKIQKFIRIINRELDRRKKLLSEHGVGTIALYREVTGKQEPTMVILMDSYESMKDEPYETDLFKLFMRISREGLSIGVHLIITASRQNNLRAQLYSNFKHQLTLPQNDISEVRGIVGATPLAATMEDIKGRALMKRDEVDVVQFALPVAGDNDIQIINNLRGQVQSLKEMWTGHTPAGIPMVPDELTEAAFYGREDVAALLDEGKVPLGLDLETVEPVTWDLKKGNLLYLTDKEEQMTQFVKQVARSKQKVIVLAPTYNELPEMEGVTILSTKEDYVAGIKKMEENIQLRLEQQKSQHEATIVLYNQLELMNDLSMDLQSSLNYVLEKGARAGYATVAMSGSQLNRKIDEVSKSIKLYKQAIVAMRITDQSVLNVINRPVREEPLDAQVNYYVEDGFVRKVKVLMK